jgi:hypothetical protein
MKMKTLIRSFSLLLLGLMVAGFTATATATPPVDVVEYTYDVDLADEPPYQDCSTGEDMQAFGIVRAHVREITTPSGNLIWSGWVDYNAYGGVTLVNQGTGDIWTLTNGTNPFHGVEKVNGFLLIDYNWSELYRGPNDDNQNFHVHLKGHIKIKPDGTVTTSRVSYTCR